MNAVNGTLNALFDALLTPLEWAGQAAALILFSGVFGVLALLVFKQISWQAGIKLAKDKIKGHVIAIRLYQDDLVVVAKSVGSVLVRNVQYLGLNFGPFLPLAIPFVFVSAQFVVRYAYAPLPLVAREADVMSGRGVLLEIELASGRAEQIRDLKVTLPPGLRAVSPLVRSKSDGRAYQEFVASDAGQHEIVLELGGVRETKLVVAGADAPRAMQPRRVSSADWLAVSDPDRWPALWPAEPAFEADSPFRVVSITYPYRDQGWLPEGEFGILLTFVLASMLFGFAALKPLGVQI
jgi:hypothetical protein